MIAVPIIDPKNPPIKPKKNVLRFFPSVVGV